MTDAARCPECIATRVDSPRCTALVLLRSMHHARPPQRPRAHVRRAQPEVPRRRRASVHPDAEPRRARGARHALHVGVHDVPDLRAGARGVRGRPLRARDRLLGQRRRLRRLRAELASRAARGGPARRVDRQAALPRAARRRSRLHARDRADARRSRASATSRASCATTSRCARAATRWRSTPAPASRPTPCTTATSPRARRSGCTRRARRTTGAPWVLFVSFVAPHFPLTAPPEWFYRYAGMDLPMPKQYRADERPRHPAIDEYARVVDYDTHFADERDVRRALAGYAGLVSAMDENVGKVLRALRRRGPRRRHRRHLHQRSRRQHRRARAVGQVDVLRGVGRRADDRRGPGIAARQGGRRAGLARRLRARDTRCGRRAAARPAVRPLAVRHRERRHARAPGALRVPRDRLVERRRSCCATVATSTATTSGGRRSCSTSTQDPEELVDLASDAAHAAILRGVRGAAARRSSIRRRSTRGRRRGRRRCSRRSAAARRRWRVATWASRPRPGTRAEID